MSVDHHRPAPSRGANPVKLTVAIPTYNRAAYLRRAVKSILDQLVSVPPDVMLTLRIYDNLSSDETPALCIELAAQAPQLEVVRHTINIGGDANILRGLTDADGDYVWVIGDDDYLRAGTLGAVCRLLGTRQFGVLKMNALEERDLDSADNAVPGALKPALHRQLKVERFRSATDILQRFGLSMGNFSSLVFSCEFFRAFYRPAAPDLFRSGYSQLEWIYRGLHERAQAFGYVSVPVLVLRIENVPRGVSPERIREGLDVMRDHLVDIGYPASAVDAFRTRQCDAILIGEVKARKILGGPIWREFVTSLLGLSNFRQRAKLLVIAALPSRLYRKIWVRL